MAAREIVRVLTIKNRTEGAQEVARELNEVKRAADGVVQASERTERATLSNSRAFDRLQRSVDPAYRSHRQFQSAIQTLSRAVEQNNTSLSEANRLAAMAATRYGVAAGEVRDLASAQMMLSRGYVASNRSLSSVNDNVRTSSFNVGNLAAQFQDVGVSAAMGMGAMQIALQQGTQLSAELGPMGAAGAVKSLGAAFLSVISPISLVTIGLVGLAAAGLQMVDWGGVAQVVLNGVASALEVIAPYATMAAAGLALLYAPTIIGGIVSLIAWLGRISVAAMTAAATMAAANPGVAFVLGITAAVAAANIFRDELAQIFGVDIVGAAKDGVNAVIGAFVGGYNYVVTTWDDLPLVFSGLGKKAYNALLDELAGKTLLTIPGTDIEWKTPSLSGLKSEVTKEEEAAMNGLSATFGNAMGQDYLGDIGGAISRGASGAADKLRELASGIGAVEEEAKKGKSAAEKMADRYADIVRGAEQFIAAQELEQQAIGLTEEAANRLRYEQDLLNKAANQNIQLTPQQAAELKGLAASMAEAEAETTALKEAFEFAKETTRGFIQDFRQGLQSGEGFWKSFADAATNALDKIIDKLLNEVLDAVFQVNRSAGGMGGGGGFLSSIFGGLGNMLPGSQWSIAAGGGIGLYDSGGWTGSGNPRDVAGLVHREEFVVKAGPARRNRAMLEAMNSNRSTPANSGGVSVVQLQLSPDLEARILQEAAGQTIKIADKKIESLTESRQFGTLVQGSNKRRRQGFIG